MIPSQRFAEIYTEEKVIYQKEETKILLVRHKNLGELRICKILTGSKARLSSSEAHLLSELRHPGIPRIFDYEESCAGSIIIEEYVPGISLNEYLYGKPDLTEEFVISLGLQLAEILAYFHSRNLIYQDLKPENVILQGNLVRLVDLGSLGSSPVVQGTPEYLAPEIKKGAFPGASSDIYSLGKVLEKTEKFSDTKSHKLERLLGQMTASDPDLRPESAEAVCQALTSLQKGFKSPREEIVTEIAVIGTDHGVGTSHIAISLTCYLNETGMAAYYENSHDDGFLQRIQRNSEEFSERKGTLYHNNFRGRIQYGPGMESDLPPKGIRVLDCGTDFEKEADLYLCVIGMNPWKCRELPWKCIEKEKTVFLANPNRGARRLAFREGVRIYGFPADEDPFHMTKRKRALFRKIQKEWLP